MKANTLPPSSLLWDLFEVDLWTGVLYLKGKPGHRPPGHQHLKYTRLTIDGKRYLRHLIVWKWFTGNDPSGMLDHVGQELLPLKVDGIFRLEEVSNAENVARGFEVKGRRLPRHVYETPSGSFQVKTRQLGHIGNFTTLEDAAIAAYDLY